MTRVLLVSVGGSPEPIVQAARTHHPDELIFICSAPPCEAPSLEQVIGEGLPCRHGQADGMEDRRANLVTQLGLAGFRPDLQIVALPDPDDLVDCHRRITAFCQELRQRFTRLELLGDYSGGTKTMSTALAMALVDQGATLSLMAGQRTNLERIERSEGSRTTQAGLFRANRRIREQLPLLLESHFYDRAAALLRELRVLHGEELASEPLAALQELEEAFSVLMLWDRFRWEEALAAAESTVLPAHQPELIEWWQRVVASRRWLDHDSPAIPVTGYELVQDLLLNAERRGLRGWFDDAVARLYRALELLAQTYIQLEHGLDHVDFWESEQIQRDRRQWRLRPGLAGLYRWLEMREGAVGLGGAAAREWHQLRALLESRNCSLLGHGLRPVSQSEWEALQLRTDNLVQRALEQAGCRQGPPARQLPGLALLQHPCARLLLEQTTP